MRLAVGRIFNSYQFMSFLERQLQINKSQLPGAGQGLFTKIDIQKGTRIVEYKGRLHRWKDIKHEDGHNGYLLYINPNAVINALGTAKLIGRYANDANGIIRIEGLRNNSEYVTVGSRCFITATKNIKKGEEVFVKYGKEYWELVKKIKSRKIRSSQPKENLALYFFTLKYKNQFNNRS
ncbi:MAG: SET domain-containing protein [Bacteroidia bacterium]|nr:SET domain-containing protein [Bacteroidia bacterium]